MPTTHWTFLAGALALAGFPLFSGFWSKDAIFVAVHQRTASGSGTGLYGVLYALAVFTAFLTALYTFRAVFLTFYGEEKIPYEAGGHAHESPRVMTVPLVILALFALGVGAVLEMGERFAHFLEQTPSVAYLKRIPGGMVQPEAFDPRVMLTSSLVALAGIGLAAILYLGRAQVLLDGLTRWMKAFGLHALSSGKFFVDITYNVLIVWPLEGLARLSYWFDRQVIDGLVDLAGWIWILAGAALRPLQNGLVQFYALAMALGLLVLIAALLAG
jgi:NADH-quinone oxidoreductase subunit L